MNKASGKQKARDARDRELRNISVEVHLDGGHRHELLLREDAPELADLFRALASRGSESVAPVEQFFQLPVDEGKAACSFNSTQLVSVITQPPVVVRIEQPETPAKAPAGKPAHRRQQAREPVAPTVIHTPRHLVIDDFLSEDEHRDMVAYALANKEQFQAATVTTNDINYRRNLVIMDFQKSAHSTLVQNRLLVWFPQIMREFNEKMFPLETVESQLTASNEGHYFKAHQDGGSLETRTRTLTCVYYFFRQPRGFAGGALRLYDTFQRGDKSFRAETFNEVEPVSNRLVVFPSNTHHELMRIRCPSRLFADSRFAITTWIRRADKPDAEATMGWGHFHCGAVPTGFE
jgi:Rps23 Pro-64 3,4-dihydroxylase Tpa1-like proline 4-hydroxylase